MYEVNCDDCYCLIYELYNSCNVDSTEYTYKHDCIVSF